uniref:Uncharacterized protein n=1 Tax=Astyanax mexicanus TaxID=7994 RepID=A0A8B9HUL9_ASTMX
MMRFNLKTCMYHDNSFYTISPRKYKCGLSAPCPPKHLAFRLVSGAANVIGPKICLEDKILYYN